VGTWAPVDPAAAARAAGWRARAAAATLVQPMRGFSATGQSYRVQCIKATCLGLMKPVSTFAENFNNNDNKS
jgi:hypothetical protein